VCVGNRATTGRAVDEYLAFAGAIYRSPEASGYLILVSAITHVVDDSRVGQPWRQRRRGKVRIGHEHRSASAYDRLTRCVPLEAAAAMKQNAAIVCACSCSRGLTLVIHVNEIDSEALHQRPDLHGQSRAAKSRKSDPLSAVVVSRLREQLDFGALRPAPLQELSVARSCDVRPPTPFMDRRKQIQEAELRPSQFSKLLQEQNVHCRYRTAIASAQK
jgi:hypothetical protein